MRYLEQPCSVCGSIHDPGFPHNTRSLQYQYSFYAQYGRWPTWEDAMAHCSEKSKAILEAFKEGSVDPN